MLLKNKVQLITYPDGLGGNLKSLDQVLKTYLVDAVSGGIHLLPPFPSSGDRGFAPLDYFQIEPAFGDWEDVKKIGEEFDLLIDLMVNHISRQSLYFQDFLERGMDSQFADMFITPEKVWHDGQIVQEDINKVFLRRDRPYSTFKIGGSKEEVMIWTTFGSEEPSEQIDLDVHSEQVKDLLKELFANFHDNNIRIVRLDAVGYVIKKMGTSCFFVEPEIYEFLNWIRLLADSYQIELLPEVHANSAIQYKLAEKGFWIYDFILPYLILETIITTSTEKLKQYLIERPHNQFTMLDCHDGVPVLPDLEGFIDPKVAQEVVDICVERGSNLSLILSDDHKEGDFGVHQIGGTYYSILDEDDDAYLISRAIQFFTPGIPQVYYVGLLAGINDFEAVEKTGEIREINRHNFTLKEIDQAFEREVVRRLIKLMEFRNGHPAFNGQFRVINCYDSELILAWLNGEESCELSVNLKTKKAVIKHTDQDGNLVLFQV